MMVFDGLWLTHVQHYSMFFFLRTFARSNTLQNNSHPRGARRLDFSLHEMGVSENVVYPEKPNGFADHYPYEKWLFHWEY